MQHEIHETTEALEQQAIHRECLHQMKYRLLRDKGIFYFRFCEELRTLKRVQTVTKKQTVADYATNLKTVQFGSHRERPS